MKLKAILLLGFASAFLIIGIDQTIKLGFGKAYWAIMASLLLFFIYNLQKRKDASSPQSRENKPKSKKPGR